MDLDSEASQSEIQSFAVQEETVTEEREDNTQIEEEKVIKEKPEPKPAAESDNGGDGEKESPIESSFEPNNSCDSERLELQLSSADNGPLHIEEREDSPVNAAAPQSSLLENGVSGINSEKQDLNSPHKVCYFICMC